MTSMVQIRELDEVLIPEPVAKLHGTESTGTVVWFVSGSRFATVECKVINSTKFPPETKLVDVPIGDIIRVELY
jgi:hypothetical protein